VEHRVGGPILLTLKVFGRMRGGPASYLQRSFLPPNAHLRTDGLPRPGFQEGQLPQALGQNIPTEADGWVKGLGRGLEVDLCGYLWVS